MKNDEKRASQIDTKITASIKIMNNIFKRGYMPSRGRVKYNFVSKYFTNCFGHACFNLTNSQLIKLGINNVGVWSFFGCFGLKTGSDEYIKTAKNKIESVGLKIEESSLDEKIETNQWKVAYYYHQNEYFGDDFHFLRQEKDGSWSGKFASYKEIEYFDKPPKKYGGEYFLKGIYKITNPYVSVENDDQEME